MSFDETLAVLFDKVRLQRKSSHGCFSAQDDVDIPSVLEAMIKEDAYRDDYENVTAHLLFEAVPYEAAARSILLIAEFARIISVH